MGSPMKALHPVTSILSRFKTDEIEEESDEELDIGDEVGPDYELEVRVIVRRKTTTLLRTK